VCMHVCIYYVCVYACMYILCVYVCMYIYYVCVICMYVCMHAWYPVYAAGEMPSQWPHTSANVYLTQEQTHLTFRTLGGGVRYVPLSIRTSLLSSKLSCSSSSITHALRHNDGIHVRRRTALSVNKYLTYSLYHQFKFTAVHGGETRGT
jgi:hypothetical protein